MSRLIAALRSQCDQRSADYIDARLDALKAEHETKLKAQADQIRRLTQTIADQAAQIDALADRPFDETRYILTKAKVVRLMKHLGIYDEPVQ